MAAAITFLLLELKWFSVTSTEVVPPLLYDFREEYSNFIWGWQVVILLFMYLLD